MFTMSYLTDNETHSNAISVGDVRFDLIDEYPEPPEPDLNEQFVKRIAITNTGDIPCFVRIFVEFSNNKVSQYASVTADGTNYYTWADFKNHLPANWVYIPYEETGDNAKIGGYFYYTEPLPVGETTSYLTQGFKVTFPKQKEVLPYEINVYAEALQTLNHNAVEYTGTSAYRDAWLEFISRKELTKGS